MRHVCWQSIDLEFSFMCSFKFCNYRSMDLYFRRISLKNSCLIRVDLFSLREGISFVRAIDNT